ncbi:MAG: hypothetical protein GY750_00200 [Lentisphaerae bacterium]|nr:hypothetical protein [Lentisphaerota bacterium]MCP4099841.1 hypothetical protein [Lentisphaerota bacterium]
MRILMVVLFLLAGTFCVPGCSSSGNGDSNKLTDKEKTDLVNFARYFLTKNDKFATQKQKAYILKNEPTMKIHYIAPKTGKAVMDWVLKDKTLRVICRGEFCTDKMQWKVAVYKSSKPKVISSGASYSPNKKKLTRDDFSDLLNRK